MVDDRRTPVSNSIKLHTMNIINWEWLPYWNKKVALMDNKPHCTTAIPVSTAVEATRNTSNPPGWDASILQPGNYLSTFCHVSIKVTDTSFYAWVYNATVRGCLHIKFVFLFIYFFLSFFQFIHVLLWPRTRPGCGSDSRVLNLETSAIITVPLCLPCLMND